MSPGAGAARPRPPTAWETRTVSLSSYYGATARLAFEFNTVDSA